MAKYEFQALRKPSSRVDPCCVCQKEFSKQIRIAVNVVVRNKNKMWNKESAKPAKAGKEGICIIIMNQKIKIKE